MEKTIESILEEIRNESSTNGKIVILDSYKDTPYLKEILYLTYSRRIKFYIKAIPESKLFEGYDLDYSDILEELKLIYTRVHTGDSAINRLISLLQCLPIEKQSMVRGIVTKDLKLGMGTTLINKVYSNLIEKTGYMGCKPYSKELVEELLNTGDVIAQEKMDGRYMNVVVDHEIISPESRQGETTHLGNWKLWDILKALNEQFVLNGELLISGVDRYTSNGLLASIVTIEGKRVNGLDVKKLILKFNKENVLTYEECFKNLRYHVWDMITIDEYYNRYSERMLNDRLLELEKLVYDLDSDLIQIVESIPVNNLKDINEITQKIINLGGEGTVVKSLLGKWEDKKPKYQIKIKKEFNVDLKIVGFNLGTGKNANKVSSLNAMTSDNKLFTKPTGIKEEMMDYITENQDELLGTIVEVKCSGLSQDRQGNYSLLHPVFKSLRDDKIEADDLEQCKLINESTNF